MKPKNYGMRDSFDMSNRYYDWNTGRFRHDKPVSKMPNPCNEITLGTPQKCVLGIKPNNRLLLLLL